MRLIREYLLREIIGLFTLSLVIITMLFMSQRIIQLTEWAINRGVGIAEMAMMMVYLLPSVLIIIIPIVTLFSILLAVGRLAADNEITAMKASGISLHRLFPPVLVFSLFASTLALYTSQVLAPKAARASRTLQYDIVRTSTEAMITERTFTRLFSETTFYIREKRADGKLKGVVAVIEAGQGNPSWRVRRILFARAGRFVHDPALLLNELWLSDGVLIQEDRATGRDDLASFTTLRFLLMLEQGGTRNSREEEKRQELDMVDLAYAVRDLAESGKLGGKKREERLRLLVQWHERMAFPIGCLVLCFWAVPLGIQPPRGGRARAIVVSVLLSGAFYYLMILAKVAALYDKAPPGLAMWAPDLAVFITGAYMLRQKNLERPIPLLSWIEDAVFRTADRIKEYREKRKQS